MVKFYKSEGIFLQFTVCTVIKRLKKEGSFMKKILMLLTAMALVFLPPALLSAQMCTPGQCMVEPGLRNNMGAMSAMMGDMHQMLQSGKLTPAQQQYILEMMNQMSGIMKDMGSPEGLQKQDQIQQQLQQMQKGLQDMKAQLSK
jgi:hypothetical protein